VLTVAGRVRMITNIPRAGLCATAVARGQAR
jgi:hypothetical protein